MKTEENGFGANAVLTVSVHRRAMRTFVCNYFLGSFGNIKSFRRQSFGLEWWNDDRRRDERCELRSRRSAAVAHFEEAAVGAEVLPVVTRFVTIDEFERTGIVAESAEGYGGAGGSLLGWVQLGGVRDFGLPAHFVIHTGLFHAPDTYLTPAGDGHVLDEGFLEGGLRLEFFEEMGEETEKAIRGLAFEDYRAGEHSVSEGVTGGSELTLRTNRAVGFGAVDAGCVLLTFGAHTTRCCYTRGGDFGEFGRIC